MEKFLNILVTNEQSQLVSATDVKLVEQANTTSVTITYSEGKVVTITHAALGAGIETMRDQMEDAIVKVTGQKWQTVTIDVTPVAAVSGIAIA